MDPASLTTELKRKALELGFQQAGVCPSVAPPGIHRFYQWLEAGYHGQMDYLETRKAAYADPASVLENAKSILMLTAVYHRNGVVNPRSEPLAGEVSRYASSGWDYHDVVHKMLKTLVRFHDQLTGGRSRGVIDTAPLLEREYAQLAGLGWIAKNTMLISKSAGSWFFLAALLSDQALAYDEPVTTDHCGTCQACLEACPTQAFPQPYVLDATRCISYLTIELRSEIPESLRDGIGDWLFGCDICQEVCPWNNKSATTENEQLHWQPELRSILLPELFDLDDDQFRNRFRKTPLWRAKRRGVLRNAAIVLGNMKDLAARPALAKGLHDTEPLVREACMWALEQLDAVQRETL